MVSDSKKTNPEDKMIDEFYKYYKKWDENSIKVYNGKSDFKNTYLNILNNNPKYLYEIILALFDEITKNENINNKKIENKLKCTLELLILVGKTIPPYKLLKNN